MWPGGAAVFVEAGKHVNQLLRIIVGAAFSFAFGCSLDRAFAFSDTLGGAFALKRALGTAFAFRRALALGQSFTLALGFSFGNGEFVGENQHGPIFLYWIINGVETLGGACAIACGAHQQAKVLRIACEPRLHLCGEGFGGEHLQADAGHVLHKQGGHRKVASGV
jgi:hypothetical protein